MTAQTVCAKTPQTLERPAGIEPATFSLGS